MKRLLYALILTLALAGSAGAAHLVCDPMTPPVPANVSYVFTGQPAPLPTTATGTSVKADGSLYLDISGIANGIYPLTVKVCVNDPIYGGQACSATVPFSLVRPSVTVPGLPANITTAP